MTRWFSNHFKTNCALSIRLSSNNRISLSHFSLQTASRSVTASNIIYLIYLRTCRSRETMASRRAVQQLRLRYGSSVSASASTLEAGVVFGVASRTSATRTSYTASNAILGVGRPAPTWLNGWRSGGIGHSVRCYSTGGQNQAPSSRIWAFEEIKKQVEAKNSKDNVVFVGM